MEPKSPKGIFFVGRFFLIIMLAILLGGVHCSQKQMNSWFYSKPETRPNTAITKRQVDMVRIGDSEVKAQAVLGQPTVKKSTQDGTEMVWYLLQTEYSEEAYETLKKPPKDPEGYKFIRIYIDPSGKITEKQFEL